MLHSHSQSQITRFLTKNVVTTVEQPSYREASISSTFTLEVTSCLLLIGTPGNLVYVSSGLNEALITLDKVRFRAFKVFVTWVVIGQSTVAGAYRASLLGGKINILDTQRSFCTRDTASVTALKDCVTLISCVSAFYALLLLYT